MLSARHVTEWSLIAAFASIWLLPGGAFWLYREAPPSRTIAQRPLNSPVKAGEALRLEYVVVRRRASHCSMKIQPFIIDGAGVRRELKTIEPPIPEREGRDVVTAEIRVPPEAAPGPAIYRPLITYHCNIPQSWRPPTYPLDDLEFVISG